MKQESNQVSTQESMQERLFLRNREWAKALSVSHPGFFQALAAQQSPEYLWIGCSDSRIPPNELLGLLPGELFVHRNIANVVVHTDLNCLTVLQFAVDVLKVKHVIVCGHYGCGGVTAVLNRSRLGLVDNWLHHVEDVQHRYERYLGETLSQQVRLDRLCELNVMEQVANLSHTSIVRDAWERGQPLTLHGWVYGLKDGLLRDLGVASSNAEGVVAGQARSFERYERNETLPGR
ncbi:MAG: carbonate dehydratase [Herbaspirillum sp.]